MDHCRDIGVVIARGEVCSIPELDLVQRGAPSIGLLCTSVGSVCDGGVSDERSRFGI